MNNRFANAALALGIALAGLATAVAWRNTTGDPVVRRAVIALPDYPAGAAPVRVLLLSDTHAAGPEMPPARLGRIVAQANALRPDLVVLAGDFMSEKSLATRHYTAAGSVAPFARLKARLGVVAVLGNHDFWHGRPRVAAALRAAGITVLANDAVRRGPLVIGGLDDTVSGYGRLPPTLTAMRRLQRGGPAGARVLVTHSPYAFPIVPPDIGLTLAGHSHCGQIRFPWGGSPAEWFVSGYRPACGVMRSGKRTMVVTAGLGTSTVPVRFLVPADMWLVTIGPAVRPAAAPAPGPDPVPGTRTAAEPSPGGR